MAIPKHLLFLSTAILGASLAACSGGEGGEQGEGGETPHAMAGEGGEGGEGGEAGEGGASSAGVSEGAARVYVYGQMRGHLAVAKALHDSGDAVASGPHFMHPVVEVMASNPGQFGAEMTSQLTEAIEALALAGEDGSHADEVQDLYDGVIARIDTAIGTATLSEHAEGMSALIGQARQEYGEGVDNGEISDVIEYQDAWGFIAATRASFNAHRAEYDAVDAAAAASLDDALQALQVQRGAAMEDPPAAIADIRASTTRVQLAFAAFQ